jgi:hypothetical protein
MKIKEIHHDDWYSFANQIIRSGEDSNGFFRGQKNPEWGLVPGAYRQRETHDDTSAISGDDYSDIYLERFRKYASGVLSDAHNLPVDDDDQLVIWAQNYGLKTRLLDWSLSPFVAAFFAYADIAEDVVDCINEQRDISWIKNTEVVVWHLDKNSIPFGVEMLRTVPKRMHRTTSQGSVLLTVDPSICTDILKAPAQDWMTSIGDDPGSRPINKHVLPGKDCFIALDVLRSMNIHYASLFPDLYGAAKQANMENQYKAFAYVMRRESL